MISSEKLQQIVVLLEGADGLCSFVSTGPVIGAIAGQLFAQLDPWLQLCELAAKACSLRNHALMAVREDMAAGRCESSGKTPSHFPS